MKTSLFNEAAEQMIVGYLISGDKQAIDEIMTRLSTEDFYITNYRYIYIAANNLWKNRKPVNLITIYENLKDIKSIDFGADPLEYLTNLSDLILSDLGTTINVIKQNSMYRRAKAAVGEFVKSIEDNPKQTINTLITQLTGLDDNMEVQIKTLADSLASAMYNLESKEPAANVKSGFRKFDNNIQLINKEVVVIAARPGTGKSAFAAQVATNMAVAQNKKVAFFSLEMANTAIAMRLLANESNSDLKNLFRKQYNPDMILDAYSRLATDNMFIFDSVYAIEDITKYCRMLKMRGGLDCVVIDYLQLVMTKERFKNTNDRVAYISRALKLLASELDIPVIALSQMSRDIEKRESKTPKMSDVRDSGAIEQDASVLVFFTEDKDKSEVYGDIERYKFIKAYVAKNRNGATGYLNYKFTSNLMRFEEVDNNGMTIQEVQNER